MQPRQQEQQEAQVQQQPSLQLHNPQQQSKKKITIISEKDITFRFICRFRYFVILFCFEYRYREGLMSS
jgi:hypothetical protein